MYQEVAIRDRPPWILPSLSGAYEASGTGDDHVYPTLETFDDAACGPASSRTGILTAESGRCSASAMTKKCYKWPQAVRLGSCGVWLTVQRQGMARLVGGGDRRISDECRGRDKASHRGAVSRSHPVCCRALRLQQRRHAMRGHMGPAATPGGLEAPTPAVSLARFLAEGVSLISYSWLGGHHTPQTPASNRTHNQPSTVPAQHRAGHPRRGS